MAVEMCADGKPVSSRDAFSVGIIDKIIEGDLLTGAIEFAREVTGKPVPKTRERHEKLGTPRENAPIFTAAREKARAKQRNLIAPLAAVDAVEASTQLSFEEGCELEQRLFLECMFSEQSKALIHVFFGEREVAKIPDVPKDTPIIPVRSVAVVGAGDNGGRHFDGVRECWDLGAPERNRSGGDRPGDGQHPQELCDFGETRAFHEGVR